MNNNDRFRIFENADDKFIERLKDSPKFTDDEKERMFKMSKKIFEDKKNMVNGNITMTENEEVNGVERYSRPAWYKPLISTAACLVVLAGVAGSFMVMKNLGKTGTTDTSKVTATQASTETTEEVLTTDATTAAGTEAVTTTIVTVPVAAAETTTESTEPATEAETEAVTEIVTEADTTEPASEETTLTDHDAELIAQATALYDRACATYWEYAFGDPFALDNDDVYIDDRGWQFTRITDDSIQSRSDIFSGFYEVFASRYLYDDILYDRYTEHDGKYYVANVGRGSDILYTGSEITDVKSIEGDEITFTVVSTYEDPGTGESETRTSVFSMVDENGTWKAGRFEIPN